MQIAIPTEPWGCQRDGGGAPYIFIFQGLRSIVRIGRCGNRSIQMSPRVEQGFAEVTVPLVYRDTIIGVLGGMRGNNTFQDHWARYYDDGRMWL